MSRRLHTLKSWHRIGVRARAGILTLSAAVLGECQNVGLGADPAPSTSSSRSLSAQPLGNLALCNENLLCLNHSAGDPLPPATPDRKETPCVGL